MRSRAIAMKYTIKLGLAHHLRKRDRLTLVLIHVMESDLACEAAPFPSGKAATTSTPTYAAITQTRTRYGAQDTDTRPFCCLPVYTI